MIEHYKINCNVRNMSSVTEKRTTSRKLDKDKKKDKMRKQQNYPDYDADLVAISRNYNPIQFINYYDKIIMCYYT